MLQRIKAVSDELKRKGYVLEIYPINQIENGFESLVASGDMPLVTYTATIFDDKFYSDVACFSFDTFSESLDWAIEWCEKKLSHL